MRPEVFAFSTSLTRLTAVLSHRSAEVALERANAQVTDRYGGTFIGRSLGALLAPPHGNLLRGAVVIIASDGWDSDPPDVLGHAMARLRRRAEVLVWLNPRAAHGEFQPLAGSMAAALPYCDLFLPAHSLAGLREFLLALARQFRRIGQDRPRHGTGMGEPGGHRRNRRHPEAPEAALGAAGNAVGSGGLAVGAQGPAVRHLALLVAGASAGLPDRCPAA